MPPVTTRSIAPLASALQAASVTRSSIHIDFQSFWFFDREGRFVTTSIRIRYGYCISAGGQAADVFRGGAVTPGVSIWCRAAPGASQPTGRSDVRARTPVSAGTMAYEAFGCWMNRKPDRRAAPCARAAEDQKAHNAPARGYGTLQIQTYDEVCFPGLEADWAKLHESRPFVGTLSMGLDTDADDEVASWIAAGTPPICFGFGSMPLESAADTVAMIASVCAELGERALICSGWTDYSDGPQFDHVKVVGAVSYEKIFPHCRAVVHHGGSGTTAAALRAGVPSLILWMAGDQPFWGAQLKRLKVGHRPEIHLHHARDAAVRSAQDLYPGICCAGSQLGARMIPRAESVSRAADLLEDFARVKRGPRGQARLLELPNPTIFRSLAEQGCGRRAIRASVLPEFRERLER